MGPREWLPQHRPQHHDLHEHRDHDLDRDSSTTHQAKQNNQYHQYNHTIQIKEVKQYKNKALKDNSLPKSACVSSFFY
jgi:hypothetical protein